MTQIVQQRFRERHREELRIKSRRFNQTPERKRYMAQWHSVKRFDGMREKALERDNFRCQRCGKEYIFGERSIVVHHLDHNLLNNSLDNLATLCRSCHPVIHGPHSEEHRRKIGEAHKGRIVSAATRQKMSESQKGKPGRKGFRHNPETIVLLKQRKQEWWQALTLEQKAAQIQKMLNGRRK